MKQICILLIVALVLVTACGTASAFSKYRVVPGDNLYKIGQKFGVAWGTVMAANNLTEPVIYPGQFLIIPLTDGTFYQVNKGDNLFRIAQRFSVTVEGIKAANALKDALIYPGQRLVVLKGKSRPQVTPALSSGLKAFVTEKDIELIAKLINAEARGENYLGQVAVGAVILNRLTSGQFPGSVSGIVFQKTNGVYQFTPVRDGSINLKPNDAAVKAAKAAVTGVDPTGGALYFYNPKISSDRWIKTLPVTRVIGNHVFAK